MRPGKSVVRRSFTFSNVCSFLALTIALGTGTAYAANTVFSADIVNGEVKNPDLGADAVTSSKVLTDTLTSADLATNSVGALEVTNNSVGANELAPNAVVGSKLAGNAVDSSKVGGNALTGADINESTLAGVNAGTVGGMSVKKINFQVPYGTSQRLILDFPGKFAIYGECQDFGDIVDLKAVTSEGNSTITAWVNQSAFILNDADDKQDIQSWFANNYDPPEIFDLDDILYKGSTTSRAMRIEFATPSGFVVHVDLFVWVRQFQPQGCVVYGTAIGG